ncbi:MAG TPA: PHB depolymerase family esterase, partial [Chitinispirillaceae bacterium]|nr:PHB depolymerase family esterase [Chitinispirillaceae bacterium]
MSAPSQQNYTKMDAVADREKFIVVYPEALSNSSNQKSWDLSGPNDFEFIMAIIDTIDKEYQIDKKRIYACGFSQGGFMSFQLACRYSDIFAAIAPTSGTVSGTCNLKRPVPMRLTFGTNEFDRGAAQTAQFMQSVAKWVELLNCPENPVITRPYPSNNPNSVVTRLYYGPCDGDAEVIADSVRTGGHEWPMNTNDRINNSEETWAFLNKFSLKDGGTVVHEQIISRTTDIISATFNAGIIHLRGVKDKNLVKVIDTKGRMVARTTVNQSQISLKNGSVGMYILQIFNNNNNNKPVTIKMVIH